MSNTKNKQVIFLDYGSHLIIPVYGEEYAQDGKQTALKRIYKQYGNKVIDFSLLPQSDYQKSKGWPESPFLNVAPKGHVLQTKDNWLGYIHPFEPSIDDEVHKDRKRYIEKLIFVGDQYHVIIKGKVIKEDSTFSLLLFASHKEIDSYFSTLKTKTTKTSESRIIDRKTSATLGSKKIGPVEKHKKEKFYNKWWFWFMLFFFLLMIASQKH